MRKIEKIIVHCSAGSQQNNAADIVSYHTRPKSQGGRGWTNPGYHYIIEADGKIVHTLGEDHVSNGCYGHNQTSINVCYIGGVDTSKKELPPLDNRTPQQREALRKLLRDLKSRYPEAHIHGHRDFAAKACPSFDATREFALLSAIFILFMCMLCSCRTRSQIHEVPIELHHSALLMDSLRSQYVAQDSILIKDSVVTLIKNDTLIRESWRIRERIHIVHDTLSHLRHDTLYREIPITVTDKSRTMSSFSPQLSESSKAFLILILIAIIVALMLYMKK